MASAVQVVLDANRRGDAAERLLQELRARVIGQNAALERIVDTYQTQLAGLAARNRPLANLMFLGPTGSGKTHVVESLAEVLFQERRALIKVDCAEFQHSHEIAKLIGSPPGYLGHRETHPVLTQEALEEFRTPQCNLSLVLFDEVEKASDALWQLLLGILDKATLRLGDNRVVDFSRAMIFLTGNLGAAEMEALLGAGIGFAPAADEAGPAVSGRLTAAAVGAARRRFSPEFFNRLDQVVVFQPLSRAELEQVLDLELAGLRARLLASHATRLQAGAAGGPATVRCTRDMRELLLREGWDPKFGARPLKRVIERRLVQPLATLIATGQVGAYDGVVADFDGNAAVFTRESVLVRPHKTVGAA